MSKDLVAEIDRLMRQRKTNAEIIALLGIPSEEMLYKHIQGAKKTIESEERIRRVAGKTAATVVLRRRLVEKEAQP